ncbi:MAG: protein TolQ [Holosporales bacterium]|jgi:biopolymer transport protein TolQ|nr:protein TolQ [Holosporales bacterium]
MFFIQNNMENSPISNAASDIVSNLPQDVAVSGVTGATSTIYDSSVFAMFWNAGFVIKVVVLILLAASVWSWTVIIGKHLKMKKLILDTDEFEDHFWSGTPLETLYKELKETAFNPMVNVFCTAMAEWGRFLNSNQSTDSSSTKLLEGRIDRAAQIAIRKEIDELEKGLGFLSSLGTNGVIVGLFGTVLGILNGFKAIAIQQNASIAIVAPIISEALFTTALGIVAAIPAAVGYNKLMNDTNRYINRLETFAEEFCSIVSRQFDER